MSNLRSFRWKSGSISITSLQGFWQLPESLDGADPQIPNLPISTPAAESVTAALAWTEDEDNFVLQGAVAVVLEAAWQESNDAWEVSGTSSVTAEIDWTEEGDTWEVNGSISVVLTDTHDPIKKKRSGPSYEDRRRAFNDSRKALITDLISKSLTSDVVPEEISAPVLKTTSGRVDVSGKSVTVDWTALKADMENLYALLDAYRVFMENEDDEEALLML